MKRSTRQQQKPKRRPPPHDVSSAAGPSWTYGKRGYALAHSLRQFKRHKIASFLTLLVLGLTLALPVILLFVSSSLQQLGARSLQGESLTVYLDLNVSDLDGAALAQEWLGKPGVSSTTYITRDEALKIFQDNTEIGAAVDTLGSNPLPGAIVVYPDSNTLESTRVQQLADSLRSLDSVVKVQFDLRWVKRLQAIVELIQLIGGLLAGFLTLTALLVIGNTIRLELLRRRTEMEVASLLGATTSFMNRPILYIGAMYGFLGGLVASIIAIIAFNAIREPADRLSSLYESTFQLSFPTASQFATVLAISTVLGLAGAISSLYRPAQQLTQRGESQN